MKEMWTNNKGGIKLDNELIKKALKTKRSRDYQEYKKQWRNTDNVTHTQSPQYGKPNWATFATTHKLKDQLPVRACISFFKRPCQFKINTSWAGCTHCALSTLHRFIKDVPPDMQISAVKTAYKKIKRDLGYPPPVVEILPDGSFTNEEEIDLKTQYGVIDYFSKIKEVKLVAIESRPEYITADKIKSFLDILRNDQTLEIYFGLETTNVEIARVIINKGFYLPEFESTLKDLSRLNDKIKKRLQITAYHFFKPPFIDEKSAIIDAVQTARKMKQLQERYGIKINVKFEPAIISEGTLQHYLYMRGEYTAPNYFSVAEIIAQAFLSGAHKSIKFGQRDDIDVFAQIASIPNLDNSEMLSDIDFVVYNAVQMFNTDRDIDNFLAGIYIASRTREFKKWEKEIYGELGASALVKLFKSKQIHSLVRNRQELKERIKFLRIVNASLKVLEQKLQYHNTKNNEYTLCTFKQIAPCVLSSFGIELAQIKNTKIIAFGDKKFIQSEIVILRNDEPVPNSIWVRFAI